MSHARRRLVHRLRVSSRPFLLAGPLAVVVLSATVAASGAGGPDPRPDGNGPFRVTSFVPATSGERIEPSVGGRVTGDLSEFDMVGMAVNGDVVADKPRAFAGSYTAHARTPGNATDTRKYARGISRLNWTEGETVGYGVSVYLPVGFYSAMQGQVDLMRWDNWSLIPEKTERNGIVIFGSDKKTYFVRQKLQVEQTPLVGGFTISEGQWHRLEVKSRLSQTDGVAWSEVYLDGSLVGRSTAHNYYGTPVTRIRYGIVATNDALQSKPLELWFADAHVTNR